MATKETEVNDSERWIGHTVQNQNLAAFLRKNGPAVHTKPHGTDKTIVYYENPDFGKDQKLEKAEWPGDTVATRGVVEHFAHAGTEIRSASSGRPVASPGSGVAHGNPPPGNPNDATRESTIKGDADEAILEDEAKKASDTSPLPTSRVELVEPSEGEKEEVKLPKIEAADPATSPSSEEPSPILNQDQENEGTNTEAGQKNPPETTEEKKTTSSGSAKTTAAKPADAKKP